jgi:hypothetical protein
MKPRQALEMSKMVAVDGRPKESWTTVAVAGSRKSRDTEVWSKHPISSLLTPDLLIAFSAAFMLA